MLYEEFLFCVYIFIQGFIFRSTINPSILGDSALERASTFVCIRTDFYLANKIVHTHIMSVPF